MIDYLYICLHTIREVKETACELRSIGRISGISTLPKIFSQSLNDSVIYIDYQKIWKTLYSKKTNKKLSYCWETVRRESIPRIAVMDVEMTT